MSIIVNDVRFLTQHAAYVDLAENSERLKAEYKQGEFRPQQITLSWTRGGKGEPWHLTKARVSGSMLKKDGTPGQNTGDRDFSRTYGTTIEKPTWLTQIIDRYTITLPED
jgi:hypothetical protein